MKNYFLSEGKRKFHVEYGKRGYASLLLVLKNMKV